MKSTRKRRLEAAGWKVGTAADFLGMSPEEVRVVEMKLVLCKRLRRNRIKMRLTQGALAKKLGSSQSRVAKLESGGPGASLDLLFKALFATGTSIEEIARAIRTRKRSAA